MRGVAGCPPALSQHGAARIRAMASPASYRSACASREIFRLRRSGDSRLISAGERQVTDAETLEAMQRQANNCMLANNVAIVEADAGDALDMLDFAHGVA